MDVDLFVFSLNDVTVSFLDRLETPTVAVGQTVSLSENIVVDICDGQRYSWSVDVKASPSSGVTCQAINGDSLSVTPVPPPVSTEQGTIDPALGIGADSLTVDCEEQAWVYCPDAETSCITEQMFNNRMPADSADGGWSILYDESGGTMYCEIWIGVSNCDKGTQIGSFEFDGEIAYYDLAGSGYGATFFSMYAGECVGNDNGYSQTYEYCKQEEIAMNAGEPESFPLIASTSSANEVVTEFFFDGASPINTAAWPADYKPFENPKYFEAFCCVVPLDSAEEQGTSPEEQGTTEQEQVEPINWEPFDEQQTYGEEGEQEFEEQGTTEQVGESTTDSVGEDALEWDPAAVEFSFPANYNGQ